VRIRVKNKANLHTHLSHRSCQDSSKLKEHFSLALNWVRNQDSSIMIASNESPISLTIVFTVQLLQYLLFLFKCLVWSFNDFKKHFLRQPARQHSTHGNPFTLILAVFRYSFMAVPTVHNIFPFFLFFFLFGFNAQAIIDCRFFTFIAVAGSLLGSVLCFVEVRNFLL
jgi:hypothetical protein